MNFIMKEQTAGHYYFFLQGLYTHLVSADTGPLLSRFFRYFFIDFARWKPLQENLLFHQPAKKKKEVNCWWKKNIMCKKRFRGSTAWMLLLYALEFLNLAKRLHLQVIYFQKILPYSKKSKLNSTWHYNQVRHLLRINNLYLSACLSTWLSISIFEQNCVG